MRLIDADELMDYLTAVTVVEGITFRTGFKQILTDIQNQPTIDPVKHGHWLRKKPTYTERYVCSECFATGKYHIWSDVDGLEYCPHCGAMMDEANDETV